MKNATVPLPRRKPFPDISMYPEHNASALESLSVAKKDPEEFCWSSRDWLMEKGRFFPSLIVPVDSH